MLPLPYVPLLACALAIIVLLYIFYLIRWVSDAWPLSRIPNAHPSSPFTSIWILYARYRGNEIFAVSAAHSRHGPVVRLGPREVSIRTADKSIHRLHNKKVIKSTWYSFFANNGATNTMSSLGHQEHSARRKRVLHVYSKSWLQSSEHMRQCITKILDERLLPTLRAKSKTMDSTDALSLSSSLGLDIVSAYFFGLNVAPNFMQNAAKRDQWRHAYDQSHGHDLMFWAQEILTLFPGLKHLFEPCSEDVKRMTAWLNQWCLHLCELADLGLSSDHGSGNFPEVYAHLKSAVAREMVTGRLRISEQEAKVEIGSELLDHIGATLAKALYEVSRDSSIQQDLHTELRSVKLQLLDQASASSHARCLDQLPILNGVIKEALRLRPTHPEGQPRISPPNGITICDQYIPAGVRINSYPYLLHRLEATFARPEEFIPSRWDKRSEAQVEFNFEAQERNFWAFGRGPRICLGSHLTVHILQHILAAIYINFETSIHSDSDWEKHGEFVSGTADEALCLHFRSLEGKD
ncbi:cytochrome P450 [Ophiobolus disseminans]|uniref:Cytochrome P450 n=1 Tax=Ophiobolus disseminans TaxID=1469910 RepID=A0A6A7ANR8_9PLEO|nr:cytochrome P450 [Ophiobolus disseminans]